MTRSAHVTTTSTRETLELGETIGKLIDRSIVIFLTGDLGAGKTLLVKGIAAGLGVPPDLPVTSPTFTLINEYEGRFRLFHVDLYRLSGPDDIYDLGIDDIFSENGVVAIEWAERIGDDAPPPDIDITIQSTGENERIFTLFFCGPVSANLVDGIKNFSS